MSRAKKGSKETRFEDALGRLETIVKELEDGDLPLEESLRLFEEGVRLTRLCAARLDEAQRRIDLLSKGTEGEVTLLPFDPPEEAEEEGRGPERSGPDGR